MEAMHPDREIRPSELKKSIEGLLNTEALKQKGSCVVLNAHHAEIKNALVKTNCHDGSHTFKSRNGYGKPSKKAAKKAYSSPKRKEMRMTLPKHREGHHEQRSTQE